MIIIIIVLSSSLFVLTAEVEWWLFLLRLGFLPSVVIWLTFLFTGPSHIDLIFEYAKWVIKENPEEGLAVSSVLISRSQFHLFWFCLPLLIGLFMTMMMMVMMIFLFSDLHRRLGWSEISAARRHSPISWADKQSTSHSIRGMLLLHLIGFHAPLTMQCLPCITCHACMDVAKPSVTFK